MSFFEHFIAAAWNHTRRCERKTDEGPGLYIGDAFAEGRITSTRISVPHSKRAEHLVILGKTGSGKSVFLRSLARQDIAAGRGFIFFDLHGDATAILLRMIAAEENLSRRDLSDRVIVIEPGDPEYSIGLNVLEGIAGQNRFVQLAEFAQILKQRWHLESFGPRTEELLRNSLYVLSDSGQTLLELAPLLTNYGFRTSCLRSCSNPDVREYFESRFNRASEAMQAVYRDAILNKVSAFTADPHFRHMLGQVRSTFQVSEALERGYWIILNLAKGALGEQASTLGSLFLTRVKNALFSRRSRALLTLYCDEIQNLVTFDSGLDTLLSEARKFGISVCSANQFLDQYPPAMRAAIVSVGTHIFFQLSTQDAERISSLLDGGKSLGHLLKDLPPRHLLIKSGHHRIRRAVVPNLQTPRVDFSDLYRRTRARWGRRRAEVEAEIAARYREATRSTDEVLNAWE